MHKFSALVSNLPLELYHFNLTFQSEELVKKLSDLENSASCDAAVREQIAALPPEVSDISQLAKINGK